jgi:hypothetical protein
MVALFRFNSLVFQNGNWHTPPEHVSPPAQMMPQPPQFAVSKAVLVQIPLHRVRPAGHSPSAWHTPLTQLLPSPQKRPQLPQLLLSDERSTQ